MISPNDRSVLSDALTPPAGFEFDSGFISTYSLDLVTLLGLPVYLAWMASATDTEGPPEALAVIESMRRVAGRLTVFCQRARIHAPRVASPLLGLLEPMVREVTPPHGGVFHPKVWLLKFLRHDGDEAKLVLMVSSRNLTEDASWDVCLRLEGRPGKKPASANSDIKRLVHHAMKQSTKELPAARIEALNALAEDAARAEWDIPPRFENVRFHLLGAGAKRKSWLPTPPEGAWDSLGVVSPFVEGEALARLAEASRNPLFFVSRQESLQKIAVLPKGFSYKILCEQAIADVEADDKANRDLGLHAKIFVAKRGWETHLFIGSANATNAALIAGINTEFMVELVGRANAANKVGPPDALIQEHGLGPMLRDFDPTEIVPTEHDASEALLEGARDAIACASLCLKCVRDEAEWPMSLIGASNLQVGKVEVRAWPVTVSEEQALSITACNGDSIVFKGLLSHEITSLIAFRLRHQGVELSFTLDLKLTGAPPDRDLEILRAAVKNRDGFVRYLQLLLGDWQPFSVGGGKGSKGKTAGAGADDPVPLFELMVRMLAHDPSRLSNIAKVVDRLRRESKDDETVMPPEFLKIWASFEPVLREMQL